MEKNVSRRCFEKFRSVNFCLEDEDQAGRPVRLNYVQTSLEENSSVSVEEMTMQFCSNHTNFSHHLHSLKK